MAGGYNSRTYDKAELKQLQRLAEEYLDDIYCDTVECEDLVRDKTKRYFRDIMYRNGGIMTPYLKDHHGDPRCPISGELEGLFFCALQDNNSNASIYGKKRLEVTTSAIIEYNSRAYFADFYCVPGKSSPRPHYVTIVITTGGTDADYICRDRLVALQINNNPFFQVRRCGSGIRTEVASHRKLHVELIITEDIDIRSLINQGQACLMDMNLADFGSETRVPRSKDSHCGRCNVATAHNVYVNEVPRAIPSYPPRRHHENQSTSQRREYYIANVDYDVDEDYPGDDYRADRLTAAHPISRHLANNEDIVGNIHTQRHTYVKKSKDNGCTIL